MNTAARRLELCDELNAIAKGGIETPGYFARRAPLWAELSRLSSHERLSTQLRLFEVKHD